MKTGTSAFLLTVASLSLTVGVDTRAEQLGTSFVYQGQLRQDGVPLQETVDVRFTLWDASADGNELGYVEYAALVVTNGLFTVSLDFGGEIHGGRAGWLEISVRYPSEEGDYTLLRPRQKITPTPFALALPGLRTQQNNISPNLIGGCPDNYAAEGVVGAAIGGGGAIVEGEASKPNLVTDHDGTVSGGFGNTVGDSDADPADAEAATVGGGKNNHAGDRWATVAGGAFNTATGSGACVGGGRNNHATFMFTTVAGGDLNEAKRNGVSIGGGRQNIASGEDATVSGGRENTVSISGSGAVIGGGSRNQAINNFATIGGGDENAASGSGATIGGGQV